MLRGFTPWQKRTTLLGITGTIFAFAGVIGPWLPVIVGGFSLAICGLFGLLLISSRRNIRVLTSLPANNEMADRLPSHKELAEPKAPVPLIGSHYEYANRILRNVAGYEAFALRSRSHKIRDSFALAATSKTFNFEEFIQFIAVQRMEMMPSLKRSDFQEWNPKVFLALARLLANQRTREDDLENAVRLFSFAEAFFGTKILSRNDRLINLEILGELQRFEQQEGLAGRFGLNKQDPIQYTLIQLNGIQATTEATSAMWMNELNRLYRLQGYSPVEFRIGSEQLPLDRLQTDINSVVRNGPLVSILMPTFEGGTQLISAIQSLLNQSWTNIEIIVVDDGSGPKFQSYLDHASNLSEKVKILKNENNVGAYCARNSALEVANGEFITVHDDDDWSHGDKIATQVIHLIDNPEVIGNMSSHVRVSEDLKFLRINNNPTFLQANYSSLMVRRSLLKELGPWDTVNRGGDAEFRDRIVAAYGKKVEVLKDVPLSLTRTWEGSLTSGEISRGFLDSNRRLYAMAYKQWHEKAGDQLELLRPGETRKFPIPSTMKPGFKNVHLGRFDVVFMTDYRFPGGTTTLTLMEIEASAKAGLRVGYVQAESPLNGTNPPIANRLLELQMSGVVDQISLQDHADIDVLLVRHPSVVTFMDQMRSNLNVNQTLLIVNNPPVLSDGSGMVFDLPNSIQYMDQMFGIETTLVAESGVTRSLCIGLVPERRLSERTWPGLVQEFKTAQPNFNRKPVLGRHSRDNALKWPSTLSDFDAAYTSTNYETKILGGADSLITKLGPETVRDKTVYNFGTVEVREFLDDVDFWAYFHDDKLTESFGMAIAEALAAGKVVILPPYLEKSFGDGAIYTEPREVAFIIDKLWNDPELYLEQSSKAVTYAQEHFSEQAFCSRINHIREKKVNRTA